jgi:hypothetical protein
VKALFGSDAPRGLRSRRRRPRRARVVFSKELNHKIFIVFALLS